MKKSEFIGSAWSDESGDLGVVEINGGEYYIGFNSYDISFKNKDDMIKYLKSKGFEYVGHEGI